MLTVLDCHNFWSATGGGVRRYTLEKMRALGRRGDTRYVFAMPDDRDGTESVEDGVTIEHVRAPAPPGTGGGYRVMLRPRALRRMLERHRPDVVEVGSWYLLPQLVRRVAREVEPSPALVGFWHADFPRAYVGRTAGRLHRRLGDAGEALGWWWARRGYGELDAVFAASRRVAENLVRHRIERVFHTPLGGDLEQFHPENRDESLAAPLRAGDPERPVVLFAHRFQEEKGVRTLLAAYPRLVALRERRGLPAPALVFAGTGVDQGRVERAAAEFPHVHFIGYVGEREQLARWLASCELFLALSPFETFGLSLAEAMASGTPVVSADEGAAGELVDGAGCGATVPYGDADALAAAMDATLDRGRGLGARGREHVRELTWERAFDRIVAGYRDVVRQTRAGRRPAPGVHVPGAGGEPGRDDR